TTDRTRSCELSAGQLASARGIGPVGSERRGLRSRARSEDGNNRRPQSLNAVLALATQRHDSVWFCRSRSDARASASAVDHGLRPLSGRDACCEEAALAGGGAKRLAVFVL